ncbi:hypothetical protein NFI96_002889 [Prochilodus magdalenae]|nr:hypothetical protein NFI96_002889 [Prochilodus magdalenae]
MVRQICNRITACLTDISSWMTAHHLKLNPSKTELLLIPSTHRDLAISLGNSLIAPTEDAGSLGVILDGQLSFSAPIANLTLSCRFLLYTTRRIRPFLFQEATQLLVQSLVISRLDYCNSLLAGLPLRATRPLQLVQNAAARLIFNLPKFTHVTPLLRSLHWLPVAARIRFKTLRPTEPRPDQRLPTLWQWYQHWPPVRAVSELMIRVKRTTRQVAHPEGYDRLVASPVGTGCRVSKDPGSLILMGPGLQCTADGGTNTINYAVHILIGIPWARAICPAGEDSTGI